MNEDIANDSTYIDFLLETTQLPEVQKDDRHDAIQKIEFYNQKISKLLTESELLVVEDEDSCKRALDITVDAKLIYKTIEEYRKKAIEPSRKIIQSINDCAKGLQCSLACIDTTIRFKISAWQAVQEERASIAQKTIREISSDLNISMDILSSHFSHLKPLSTANAIAYTREKMSFKITDINLIPDEYWIIDEKAIQNHIDLGRSDIPGVELFKERTLHVRRK